MKSYYINLFLAAIIPLLCSCTKRLDIIKPLAEQNNSVRYSDIEAYAKHHHETKSEENGFYIDVITNEDSDTLMYIINYGPTDGWEIISGDIRTPAIIAHADSGVFSFTSGSPAMRLWFDGLKTNMTRIKNANDSELSFSQEEISYHTSFWNLMSTYKPSPPIDDKGGNNGDWFAHTYTTVVIDEEVDHLVPKWDQDEPYNRYCPYRSDVTDSRSPVGCVAIAGGQMLYYLHNLTGHPSTMFSSASCYGDIYNYTRNFSQMSSSIWSSMSSSYNSNVNADAEAVMLAYVGHVIGMHYHNNYSWAFPSNLKNDLFPLFGITCERSSYDEAVVRQSLASYMPVIVVAADLVIPVDGDIHCFVIDGFQRTHNEYTTYHYWIPDDPERQPYYTYSSSQPAITAIRINWGWWNQWTSGINDGWYSLTDSWLTVSGGETTTWDRYRVMFHGFELQE